jgi:hypothetical protein
VAFCQEGGLDGCAFPDIRRRMAGWTGPSVDWYLDGDASSVSLLRGEESFRRVLVVTRRQSTAISPSSDQSSCGTEKFTIFGVATR